MQPMDVVAERMAGWYGKNSHLAHLENAVFFDITNVSNYAEEFEEAKPLDEISFAVPPWQFVYAEAAERNGLFLAFVVKTTEHPKDDARAWTLDIHILTIRDKTTGLEYRGKIMMTRDGRVAAQTEWETELFGKWIRALDFRTEIQADWRRMREKRAEQDRRIAALKETNPQLHKQLGTLAQSIAVETPEEASAYFTDDVVGDLGKNLPDRMMMVFFLATMLANCKNVVTTSEPVPPKIIRSRQRKNRVPVHRWYTLQIEPMQKKIRHEGIESGDLLNADRLTYERAWHICRGHFKQFDPVRPLFGRVTGRFWWPSHVRGTKAQGQIHKDYELGVTHA